MAKEYLNTSVKYHTPGTISLLNQCEVYRVNQKPDLNLLTFLLKDEYKLMKITYSLTRTPQS